jgi:hypothetical protein
VDRVRPHPRIGLATVTYLFDGEIVHRDSLGSHQPIRPGDINWMTAGRGIVHSERTGTEARRAGSRLHGLQLWVALPTSPAAMRSGATARAAGISATNPGSWPHTAFERKQRSDSAAASSTRADRMRVNMPGRQARGFNAACRIELADRAP